ncbi:hypothetical protein [Tenacibaculum sp. C7A-26P2]|uniref:hypothetical protein n=1 Tax=Tenacibaculum sp. C7A-26P2 TaxID=3447504 RepID=UPI003F87FC19
MKYFKLSLYLLALMVSLTPNISSYQMPIVYAQQKENPRKPRIPPVGNTLGLLPGPNTKK